MIFLIKKSLMKLFFFKALNFVFKVKGLKLKKEKNIRKRDKFIKP